MKPALTDAAMASMKAENAALKRELGRLAKLFADHAGRIAALEKSADAPKEKRDANS